MLQSKKVKIAAIVLAFLILATVVTVSVGIGVANAAVVKVGSRGTVVKNIQTKLKRWGYYTGSVDGIYGAKTKSAVQYFQRQNGLKADGIEIGRAHV